ncbi:hypothetical protein [Burkholderia ubonensis]|nr:hypothetical protein [Burkholderia ubonensis]
MSRETPICMLTGKLAVWGINGIQRQALAGVGRVDIFGFNDFNYRHDG